MEGNFGPPPQKKTPTNNNDPVYALHVHSNPHHLKKIKENKNQEKTV